MLRILKRVLNAWTQMRAERRVRRADAEHGTLRIHEDVLRYTRGETLVWAIPIRAICFIAERTNDHGPFLDDYFLVFGEENGRDLQEASFYANSQILEELRKSLASPLNSKLVGSTAWASNIVYPESLSGRPFLIDLNRREYVSRDAAEFLQSAGIALTYDPEPPN